ncbi:MAG: hypothetical protein K2L93_06340, partial [Muribaculaceae bacterium]|nr:hypothetical protein [Muribaculaceae bacterium]
ETYTADWGPFGESRAYFPRFYGLKFWRRYTENDEGGIIADPSKDYLSFGEFDGAENQNISAVLTIPGQSEAYKIDVIHTYKWKHNEPKIDTKIYLNGERISGSTVIIRLPNAE